MTAHANGHGPGRRTDRQPTAGREAIASATSARRRAQLVTGLRSLARPAQGSDPAHTSDPSDSADSRFPDRCDICATTIPADHRHLLALTERRIECVCEACWALRSGDPDYRPTGMRTLWLADLDLPDELWASLQIPIGLTFLMESSTAGCVVAMYPSPAGATESELHFATWEQMVARNPILAQLQADVEGLIINRLSEPPAYAIAPIDRCYELTGTVKAHWEGISGGSGVERAVAAFLARLQAEAMVV